MTDRGRPLTRVRAKLHSLVSLLGGTMKLGNKRISWRMIGIVVLGLALLASVTINFVALHSNVGASALAGRRGTIAAGKNPVRVTASGQVDWSKLPKVSPSAATTLRGRQIATNLDRLTPKQRAAY